MESLRKAKATGVYYRLMIEHVKKVLADPKRVCPDYDPQQGYEIAGFVWLQGFNDMVDGHVYPNTTSRIASTLTRNCSPTSSAMCARI